MAKNSKSWQFFLLRSEKIIIKYVFISSDINLHIVAEFHFLLGVFVGTAYISDNYCYYCLSSSVDVYYVLYRSTWAMGNGHVSSQVAGIWIQRLI